jgi:hypothetical protein
MGHEQLRMILATVAVTVPLAAGCGGAPKAGPLLDRVAAPYLLDASGTRGSMSASSVAQGTPADPTLTAAALHRDHERSAASRAWRMPDGEFVFDLAVRFDSAAHAADFMSFEVGQIGARAGALEPLSEGSEDGVFPVTKPPGGRAYVVGGTDRAHAGSVFIEGVVFAVAEQVFLVETGGPSPATLETAEGLARNQYDLAGVLPTTGGTS